MSRTDITFDEVRAIMNADYKWSLENPDWLMSDKKLPSRVDTLDYIPSGNQEIGYARRLLHLRTGHYVPRDRLQIDQNQLTYYTLTPENDPAND